MNRGKFAARGETVFGVIANDTVAHMQNSETLLHRYVEVGIAQDDAIDRRQNGRFRRVRLNGAKATLAVIPAEAREQLQKIRASRHFPQAGDAGMSLRALDEGIFKPE